MEQVHALQLVLCTLIQQHAMQGKLFVCSLFMWFICVFIYEVKESVLQRV